MNDQGRMEAEALDAGDALSGFRERFSIPAGAIYLAGHSLGLRCRESDAAVRRVLDEWGALGVSGWLGAGLPWFDRVEGIAARMASLVGAAPDEVTLANSTTVNLHQILASLYRPEGRRRRILIDATAFPSDRFAVASHLAMRGLPQETHLSAAPSRDGLTISEDAVVNAFAGGEIALAVLPSVVYTSGQLLDMPRIAGAARACGVLLALDCSHSVGIIAHALDEWDVDAAFWSTYKYLNAGPGATAGLYLNRRHFGAPGMAGWFSSRKEMQFELGDTLQPAPSAGAMQIGTPNILGLVALEGALAAATEAGIPGLRRKSLELTRLLIARIDDRLAEWGFAVVTPRDDSRRGGHVAVAHPDAVRINKALKARGVVGDYRPPDLIRLAPSPLYNTFRDCFEAIEHMREIVAGGESLRFSGDRERVG